jgi:hypothetical protein
MEIKVNTTKQKQLQVEEIKIILAKAKLTAEEGKNKFYHTLSEGIGMAPFEVISEIEKKTNETVYGGYKCVSGKEIRFSILD